MDNFWNDVGALYCESTWKRWSGNEFNLNNKYRVRMTKSGYVNVETVTSSALFFGLSINQHVFGCIQSSKSNECQLRLKGQTSKLYTNQTYPVLSIEEMGSCRSGINHNHDSYVSGMLGGLTAFQTAMVASHGKLQVNPGQIQVGDTPDITNLLGVMAAVGAIGGADAEIVLATHGLNFDITQWYDSPRFTTVNSIPIMVCTCLGYFDDLDWGLIHKGRFVAFLFAIARLYKTEILVPYHNGYHGADVAQGLTCWMLSDKVQNWPVYDEVDSVNNTHNFTTLEIVTAIVSASCHDVSHPGWKNHWQRIIGQVDPVLTALAVIENAAGFTATVAALPDGFAAPILTHAENILGEEADEVKENGWLEMYHYIVTWSTYRVNANRFFNISGNAAIARHANETYFKKWMKFLILYTSGGKQDRPFSDPNLQRTIEDYAAGAYARLEFPESPASNGGDGVIFRNMTFCGICLQMSDIMNPVRPFVCASRLAFRIVIEFNRQVKWELRQQANLTADNDYDAKKAIKDPSIFPMADMSDSQNVFIRYILGGKITKMGDIINGGIMNNITTHIANADKYANITTFGNAGVNTKYLLKNHWESAFTIINAVDNLGFYDLHAGWIDLVRQTDNLIKAYVLAGAV